MPGSPAYPVHGYTRTQVHPGPGSKRVHVSRLAVRTPSCETQAPRTALVRGGRRQPSGYPKELPGWKSSSPMPYEVWVGGPHGNVCSVEAGQIWPVPPGVLPALWVGAAPCWVPLCENSLVSAPLFFPRRWSRSRVSHVVGSPVLFAVRLSY